MQSNTTTDIPTTEVDTRIPKEELREAFGTLGDQTESIDINPKDQLKQEVIKDVQKETTFEKDKAEEFLKSTDVDRTFEKAQKDNKLVNLAKEKLPDTYGECDSILDIAKVTVKEVGKFNVRLTKEYYSIQLVVGGAMILATGLGG